MHLSIVTDEITQDIAHALQVCQDLNVDTVELRGVHGKNIVFHESESLQEIRALLRQKGMRVCAIASPFLKCPLWLDETKTGVDRIKNEEEAEQWRILQRSFELADFFGAPLVRTFSFLRVADPTSVREIVLNVLSEAVQRTEAAGLKLIIENEHACNIATGEETGWLLQRITSENFGVTWDPGNEAILGSRAFPEGYEHVRKRVLHVHLKDVDQNLHWAIIGKGTIDFVGQLRALAEDSYTGMLSLETHYVHPDGGLERATRESMAALRIAIQQAGITLG